MKANKPKSTKKTTSKIKVNRQIAKKELETSMTERLMEAVAGLGHDAGKFGKEIKKAAKQLARKLGDKFRSKDVAAKAPAKKKVDVKAIKKPVSSPKLAGSKSVIKAEKVVARVTQAKAEVKPKRAYNRRVITPVEDNTAQAVTVKKAVPVSKAPAVKKAKPASPPRSPKANTLAAKQKTQPVAVEEKNGKEQDIDNSTPLQ